MYYLDIPVLSRDRNSHGILRILKQEEASSQDSRNVRARVEGQTPAESCLKFMPYDCSSFLGRRLVTCDVLASIFMPLTELVENDQLRFRTLCRCKWNSAGIAALRSFVSDCCFLYYVFLYHDNRFARAG